MKELAVYVPWTVLTSSYEDRTDSLLAPQLLVLNSSNKPLTQIPQKCLLFSSSRIILTVSLCLFLFLLLLLLLLFPQNVKSRNFEVWKPTHLTPLASCGFNQHLELGSLAVNILNRLKHWPPYLLSPRKISVLQKG